MDFLVFFVTRLIGIAVLLAVAVYLFLAIRVLCIHPYIIYRPNRQMGHTPRAVGLDYREIFFKTKDGVTLNAWFIPAPGPKAVALHCHGNSGNIAERVDNIIKIYYDIGLSLFIFDYRGYGQSQGKPTEKGIYKDAEAAWNYLVAEMGIQPGNIIITAHSLGGPVAAYLAAKVNPQALILEGTFTTMTAMGKRIYPYLPIRLLVRQRYNTRKYLKKVHCPVLIIHSPDDTIVPFYMGRELYRAANPPKQFLKIHGSHNDAMLDSREPYINEINTFIAGVNKSKETEN
ncbi:MAG TPA: alpha/beta hydrolase [Candidatus Deferrimicrobium sp.]|nr:alpha/beta hydrolase [Candidatus Deferrimicrobium sp.]